MDSYSFSSLSRKENYCVVGELLFLLYKNERLEWLRIFLRSTTRRNLRALK
jgi:hypothetical protein